jgi:hypothetical protein
VNVTFFENTLWGQGCEPQVSSQIAPSLWIEEVEAVIQQLRAASSVSRET